MPNDGNPCTTDYCNPGPMHMPKPLGTPCGAGWCDATGQCSATLPVKCQTSNGLYQGCDGASHPGLTMSYIEADGSTGTCHGMPTDTGYCPMGKSCTVFIGANSFPGTCQ